MVEKLGKKLLIGGGILALLGIGTCNYFTNSNFRNFVKGPIEQKELREEKDFFKQ